MFKLTEIAVILFVTTLINIFTTYISWLRRRTRYGLYFALGMIGVTLWTFAAGLDYAAVPTSLKVFFAQLEILGYQGALVLFAVSMMLYAGHDALLKRIWVKILFSVIPISNIVLAWTNGLHGWLWSGFTASTVGDNVVIFEHGPAFLWTAFTSYMLVVVIVVNLLQVAMTGAALLRKQARLLLVAVSVPVISNLLYLFDVFRTPGVDWSSISFSIVGFLFLGALYGSRFLGIIPIARNLIIEQMTDGILVVDALGYLIDFNPAAQAVFGFRKNDLRDAFQKIPEHFPQVIALLENPPEDGVQGKRVEIGENVFDVHLIALTDRRGMVAGQLVVLRNISEQKRMDDALRQSEEKFFKAFHSSPDAILITRLDNGQILDVNEGFCRMVGYTREEALSSSSILLGLWANPADRERMVAMLNKDQRVSEEEFSFRTKSGKILNCLYSAELINLSDGIHILSVVRDITERKRADEVVSLRLQLWEFAATHTIFELMQKALDEIGNLTDSPIGFYHFVEENQDALSLQAWSTRTLVEFCQADGMDRHYPIEEAGVWADCVRQRRPIVHNNYASLPHRRGLPAGHAEIVRELVVPVIRHDVVVSVLGVGNKVADYDENDVKFVADIADIIWTIVEQKRANEQIRQLNAKLEQLAMTDELTGLFNRRSFFQRGADELRRSHRHLSPLSLLMVDIDGFKRINDTYGHDAGDRILRCVAETLQQNIRDIDMLARLGGEEFGVLLPNTDAEDAVKLAERLRHATQNGICIPEAGEVSVTLSIGVAVSNENINDIDHLLKNADKAMYRAKNQGRDRVVLYS